MKINSRKQVSLKLLDLTVFLRKFLNFEIMVITTGILVISSTKNESNHKNWTYCGNK